MIGNKIKIKEDETTYLVLDKFIDTKTQGFPSTKYLICKYDFNSNIKNKTNEVKIIYPSQVVDVQF